MKYILSIIIFFTCIYSNKLFSQVEIKGIVSSDAEKVVAFATVILLDTVTSTVVNHTTTNDNGYYSLIMNNNSEVNAIQVQYLGYKKQIKKITKERQEKSSITINFKLDTDIHFLTEIVVETEYTGIQVRDDTLRYNPKVFTDGSEVVLEDLLNKLPGVKVDENGNISVQGKGVSKLLINGQDFFSGNTQMATKNLSAKIAEKVEVLKNYTEYSTLKEFQSGEKTAINIIVSKEKLGRISGNISGGGGIESKYYTKNSLMSINSKIMISLIGSGNNIGERILSIEDYINLQGGIKEVLGHEPNGSSVAINLSNEEIDLIKPENNEYSNDNKLTAFNVAYQPKSNIKLNSYFIYNGMRKKSEDYINNTYTLPNDENFASTKQSRGKSKSDMYSGFLKIDYLVTPTINISYKGLFSNLNIEKTSKIQEKIVTDSIYIDDLHKSDGWNISQNLSITKSFNRHILNATIINVIKQSPINYCFSSDSLLIPINTKPLDGWYNIRQLTQEEVNMTMLDLSFIYKINKTYFTKIAISEHIDNKWYESFVGLNENNTENNKLTNKYDIKSNKYLASVSFVKNKGLFRYKITGIVFIAKSSPNKLSYHIDDKSISRIHPEVQTGLYFNDTHFITLSYKQSLEPIKIGGYITKPVLSNYDTYSSQSKINKLYTDNKSYHLHYNLNDVFSGTTFFFMGGYNRYENVETSAYEQDRSTTSSQPILSIYYKNWFAELGIDKRIKIIPSLFRIEANYEDGLSDNFINENLNKIKQQKIAGKILFSTRYKSKFNLDLSYEHTFLGNSSSLGSLKEKQITQQYVLNLKYNSKKKIRVYTEIKYISNKLSNTKKSYIDLRPSLIYSINKKIMCELSGTNILNLKKQDWVQISYNGIYISERYFRQIPGNILLKVNYML